MVDFLVEAGVSTRMASGSVLFHKHGKRVTVAIGGYLHDVLIVS